MTPQPAPDLIRLLEESRRELIAAAHGLSEAAAASSPEPGCWSVLQCVEHVAGVEERSLQRLAGAQRPATPLESRGASLVALVSSRGRRVQAPEAVRPAGRYSTLHQALEAFHQARRKTIRMVEERAADLPLVSAEHPLLGPLNGHDMVGVMVGHTLRHAAQVREIRAALGHPLPDTKPEQRVP